MKTTVTNRAYPTAIEAQTLFVELSDSGQYNSKLAEVLHEGFVGYEDQSFGQSDSTHGYNRLFSFHDNPDGNGSVLSHAWMTENNDGSVYATLYDLVDNAPRAFDAAKNACHENDDDDDSNLPLEV